MPGRRRTARGPVGAFALAGDGLDPLGHSGRDVGESCVRLVLGELARGDLLGQVGLGVGGHDVDELIERDALRATRSRPGSARPHGQVVGGDAQERWPSFLGATRGGREPAGAALKRLAVAGDVGADRSRASGASAGMLVEVSPDGPSGRWLRRSAG
ncbi:MAG: hypothetical protein R2705_17435 [Ilumatobacteraceae bacterium]